MGKAEGWWNPSGLKCFSLPQDSVQECIVTAGDSSQFFAYVESGSPDLLDHVPSAVCS